MKWNELLEQIDQGDIRPLYLFTGPENYVKNEAVQALRRKLLPEGLEELNETVLEGADALQIISAAETLPMMCDRRLVVVRDWGPLLSGKSQNEADEVQRLAAWLEDPPETCALVFYMRGEPDGKKKLTALLKKRAACVSFDPLTDAEIARWAAQRLRPLKKRISNAAVGQLTLAAGRELSRLIGELEKLAAYVGERSDITEKDVEAVVAPSLEYQVFVMIDRLLAGNMAEARALLKAALESGENSFGIIATLTRQFRSMTHIKLALEAGGTADSVKDALKLNPRAVPILVRQTRAFKPDQLLALYRELLNADYAIKSGRLREDEALDMVFLKIGMKKQLEAGNKTATRSV